MSKQHGALIKGLLLVAKHTSKLQVLKRVTHRLRVKKVTEALSITEAEGEMLKDRPAAVIIDVSDFTSREFKQRVEPFMLGIPGWVKTFFVDETPTKSRVFRAARLGVNGVLRAPISHHTINSLVQELDTKQKILGEKNEQEGPPVEFDL